MLKSEYVFLETSDMSFHSHIFRVDPFINLVTDIDYDRVSGFLLNDWEIISVHMRPGGRYEWLLKKINANAV